MNASHVEEARRLWKSVGRENVMIKVPGYERRPTAIRQLLEEGITSISPFCLRSGLEEVPKLFWRSRGSREIKVRTSATSQRGPASFVSRIDSLNRRANRCQAEGRTDSNKRALLTGCRGKSQLPTPS